MMLIPCPWCGPRAHIEFRYHGDAAALPRDWARESADDFHARTWLRGNHVGMHDEVWQHTDGCRGWIVVTRDNLTHAVAGARSIGPPGLAPPR
jgi:heterotetrameric sarcosine oxidase delta subunit